MAHPIAQQLCVNCSFVARDGTIYVTIRDGGYRLAEIVALLSGLKYQAGVQAVRRFQATMLKSKEKSEFVERMKRQLGC